jgi:hypothetical protein
MELRLKTGLILLTIALLSGCAPAPQQPDRAAARAHAAAVAEAEARAAVAVLGARVCRRLVVGIGNVDWVSGVVVGVENDVVTIQIDKPGRMSHVLDGIAVTRGAKLRGPAQAWTRCE